MSPALPRIVLGLGGDGPAWPETALAAEAALGAPVLGPVGLLRAVEAALGLGRPEPAAATRLAAWRAKLEAAGPGRFWQDSLGQDGLATAETLLSWRDGLVEGGWRPEAPGDAPRLLDLAAAETAGEALPPGLADRFARAAEALAGAPAPIGRIRLLEPREGLPPGAARLLAALEAGGAVVEAGEDPLSPALGDLGAVQGALRDGGMSQLRGDGSFALLTAETETAAAEILADWLAARPRDGRLVIVADHPTTALDAALRRRHLPALGVSRASALRGVLQLLPLAIATRWRPFDAPRMLQLLQAWPSPLPRELSRALADALIEAPGRDGPGWRSAIAEGMAALEARLDEEEMADPRRRAAPRLERARQRVALLVEAPLADPDTGLPADELRALCGLFATWAAERLQGPAAPLFHALVAASRALAEAVGTDGRALPRVEMERLTATALEPGLPNPDAGEQAAPWHVLRDAAAIWGTADTVVWWGLGQPGMPARSPWTRAEREALSQAGCALPDRTARLAALSSGWRRPLLLARKKALLVAVPTPGETGGRRHPILDELHELLPGAPASVRAQAELLLSDPAARLLDVPLPRASAAGALLPQGRAEWRIPAGLAVRRAEESASSLERLIGCAYSWVGHYAARLRPGRAAEVPEGSQLAGLLAHRLAQEIFLPGPPPAPKQALERAAARLPSLLGEMAAPFLAPGQSAELARLREDLPRAMEELAALLGRHGLTVMGTEVSHAVEDLPSPGQRFGGTIDLLLRAPDGRPVVLDLKWSGTDRYRREELREGRAVQLAAYVALVGSGNDAAFFMLSQRRLLAPAGSVFGSGEGPPLKAAWADTLAAHGARLKTVGDGTLRALGVGWDAKQPDPDGLAIARQPPCRFCSFSKLCGQEAVR